MSDAEWTSIDYNGTGVDMGGGYSPFPEGEYWLVIKDVTPSTSKKGSPMVKVVLEVDEGDHMGRKVWHYIVFMPKEQKGAGMALHFLSCIGEPFEGDFKIEPFSWIGKRAKAKIVIDEYEGKKNNKIKWFIKPEVAPATDEVPF